MAGSKGSTRPGFLSLKDAARRIQMTQRSVRILVQAGQLGGYMEGREWWVSKIDLDRLKASGPQDVTLETANRRAAAALVMAEQASRRVQELLDLLRLEQGTVPIDPDEVKVWFHELRDVSEQTLLGIVTDPAETVRWAKFFTAVTESFFDLLELETGDVTSWARLYCFARELDTMARAITPDTAILQRAHYLLRTGFSVVRSTAYFWLCTRNGAGYAAKMFPETRGNIDAGLVAIILDRASQEEEKR